MGVFAAAPISKGSYCFDYRGEVLKHDREFGSGEAIYSISMCNAAGTPFLIDASDPSAGIARFMNHDAEPNAMCVRGAFSRAAANGPPPAVHVFAKRDIATNEELVWNYGERYWERGDRTADQ